MQNKFKVALVLLALSTSFAGAQDIKSSVATVKELLALDNAAALKKAQEDAVKNGLLPAPARSQAVKGAAPEQPAPQFKVRSIYGVGADIKADLAVDGVAAVRLRQGSVITGCTVVEIAGSCVKFSPATKKTPARMCPAKACWTGDELKAESQLVISGSAAATRAGNSPGLPGQPMPAPLPQVAPQPKMVEAPAAPAQSTMAAPVQQLIQQPN